jgi:predicted deacetylase
MVVPRWYGGQPITDDPRFSRWLRGLESQGHEICLHGYTHQAEEVSGHVVDHAIARVYTDREGEFYQLGEDRARALISRGVHILSSAGLHPKGFVAPAWLLSKGTRKALVASELSYTTTLRHVIPTSERGRIWAPVITLSTRSRPRRAMSVAWAAAMLAVTRETPNLRVAAHPTDLDSPAGRRALADLLEAAAKDRAILTYSGLMDETAWTPATARSLPVS